MLLPHPPFGTHTHRKIGPSQNCECDLIWNKGLCRCNSVKNLEMRSIRESRIDQKEGKQWLGCAVWFSNLKHASESCGELVQTQFAGPTPRDSSMVGLEWGLRIYISKIFPVDSEADGLGTTFGELLLLKKKKKVKRMHFQPRKCPCRVL